MMPPFQAARDFAQDQRVVRRRGPGPGWKRLGLARLNERQQQGQRTHIARGGAVDELFDRRLEFGDPLAAAVLGDNHALG